MKNNSLNYDEVVNKNEDRSLGDDYSNDSTNSISSSNSIDSSNSSFIDELNIENKSEVQTEFKSNTSSRNNYFEDLDEENLTPGMRQYLNVKKRFPDSIVMFRMGDFYEMFYEDAKIASKVLDIVLTSRGKGEKKAPLAGIPYHSIDPYISKLVKNGYKVVIADQVEDPKLAKGLVKREVTRVITPGTITEPNMLEDKQNNYIMAINGVVNLNKFELGVAISDVSTGEFFTVYVLKKDEFVDLIAKYKPSEIILNSDLDSKINFKKLFYHDFFINVIDSRFFIKQIALDVLNKHFIKDMSRKSLDEFLFSLSRIKNKVIYDSIISSSGALLAYLKKTQMDSLSFIDNIFLFEKKNIMLLDSSTIRNLELLKNISDSTERGSLISVLDKTSTNMGARFLRRELLKPLMDVRKINLRLDAIEMFIKNPLLKVRIREVLKLMGDLERLVSRIGTKRCNPRDLISLKNTLSALIKLNVLLNDFSNGCLKPVYVSNELRNIIEEIAKAIKDEAPLTIRDGNFIKEGYNSELDELNKIKLNAKEFILNLELKEKEKTGLKNLKIKYNKLFGYFIEIPKSASHLVPEHYVRKQTLANVERYITDELKKKEYEILNANDKSKAIEEELFFELVSLINKQSSELLEISKFISKIDFLQSLASVAVEYDYVRPIVNTEDRISIINGRHPVVELLEDNFIVNDCNLDSQDIIILTGPNMAGKSTYLRQTALIVLMAQLGSFVPATSAIIGVVDKIFTRIGAYDDLTTGQSTFMVEMKECVHIISNATNKSLIIFDEVGRGTSTFDGVSIAWSLVEHIYTKIKAKTLFATHYHVLNKIADDFKHIHNYNISVDEEDGNIVFLRKVVKGGTDKSYGIHVAKLAGMPFEIIERANQIQDLLLKEDEMIRKLKVKNSQEQKTLFDSWLR